MTLGELLRLIDAIRLVIYAETHVGPVNRLPAHERLEDLWPSSIQAMEAEITWYAEPRSVIVEEEALFEVGEIRIPEKNWRYGITSTPHTHRIREYIERHSES